jgi:hypothetical protein
LLADYAGYVEVSDRSELQFRTTRQLSTPVTPPSATATAGAGPAITVATVPTAALENYGLDFFTQPRLRVRMTNRRLEFDFSYLPSLTVTDAELVSGADVQILNAASAAAAWHADRQVTVTLSEDGTYGRYNSATLTPVPGVNAATGPTTTGGTPAPPNGTAAATAPPMTTMTGAGTTPATLQTKPGPETITVVSTRTAANVSIQADRRTHVTMGAAYYATGGLGTTSQTTLPEQYGPSADAYLTHELSRRDSSITVARAYSSQFVAVPCLALTGYGSTTDTCRPRDEVAAISQGFRHDLERTTSFTAEAGVTFVRALNVDDQADRSVWLPSGRVSLAHRALPREAATGVNLTPAVNETQASLQLVPLVNPLTGAPSNFVQAQGLLVERLGPGFALHGALGGGQAIPVDSPSASTLVQGEVELDFVVGRQVNLAFGERAFWQRQATTLTTPGVVVPRGAPVAFAAFFSAVTYFAVTVRAPELRF